MRDQPKLKPFRASDFWGDRRSMRPPVDGTIARGHLRADTLLYTGKSAGKPVDQFPFALTAERLQRGRERFNIYCTPCHDYTGSGRGMIVQRGLKQPPSFHIDRLRNAPAGYFFDVITNGFGVMYDYSAQIKPEDRWAIVAYIRTLQLSQRASLSDVPPAERAGLDRPKPAPGAAPAAPGAHGTTPPGGGGH
jgi:mono/diheme cytochrome c family protein